MGPQGEQEETRWDTRRAGGGASKGRTGGAERATGEICCGIEAGEDARLQLVAVGPAGVAKPTCYQHVTDPKPQRPLHQLLPENFEWF